MNAESALSGRAREVRPLRVLLDATPVPAERGGVGRYVEAIVPALIAAGIELTVVAKRADAAGFAETGARIVIAPAIVDRRVGRFLWEQFGLPAVAHRWPADIIHSVHYTFPLLVRSARVVGVHDLTFFTQPEVHGRIKGRFFRWWIRRASRSKVNVIAPSGATASEYSRITGADPDLVHVALHGYDETVFHAPTTAEVREFGSRLDVGRSWIAFLGTLEPRKNVPALVAGYVGAMQKRPADDRLPLLLAGGKGWDQGVEPAVARAVAGGFDVRLLGYLDRSDLSAFLGGASIVTYPSLGEGFGLPVLEAMATGGVVMTTDRLAIPEVGGDAVVYVEPDAEAMTDSIIALLALDPAERDRLRVRARERAAVFTWERCAAQHVVAYRAATRVPAVG